MQFDFYCDPSTNSQSFTFTPEDIQKRGLGGAELSLVGLTTELARQGHRVTVYNDPPKEGVYEGVTYVHTDAFDPYEPREHFILYRNPLECPYCLDAKTKIFWSCDQMTAGNYASDVFPFVDAVVTISPYHKQYFVERYGLDPNVIYPIDLGVRTWEYLHPVKKKPNSLLFCSVPDRGLENLVELFQNIRWFIEDATLTITGSYSLWGTGIPELNDRFRTMFDGIEGVTFLGKVPREQLVQLQMESDILAYPNQPVNGLYELFGVSVAECQVAGCIPVTSALGAFPTTVMEQGILITDRDLNPLYPNDPMYGENFASAIVGLLSMDRKLLTKRQNQMRLDALIRFDWRNIAHQWIDTIEKVKANG